MHDDPTDDRCPGCSCHDCRCDYDEESELLYLTALDLAQEVADTDAAYRAWSTPAVRHVLPMRRAA